MDEILVSEAAATVSPAITNNSRSKFVVIWGVQNGAKLVGALFDLRGQPVSGEFGVSAAGGTICSFPVAAHMAAPSAGFAVAWIQEHDDRALGAFRRFDERAEVAVRVDDEGDALRRARRRRRWRRSRDRLRSARHRR